MITIPATEEQKQAAVANTKEYGYICILYPEDNERHATAIEKMTSLGWPFVLMRHNDDYYEDGQEKKHHVHVLMQFKNQRYLSSISKQLDVEPHLFRRLENFEGYVRYMTHMDHPERAQYLPESFEGTLKKKAIEALSEAESENDRIKRLLDLLDSYECVIELRTWIRIVCDNGLYADCRRAGYLMKAMLEEHNRQYANTA